MISDNIKTIRSNIDQKCGPNQLIRILTVSKTHSPAKIREAYDAGLKEFGENYLQEAMGKIETLTDLKITWHFIGPIQSNKCRDIARQFQWVQSLDRLKIARSLNRHAEEYGKVLDVLIQINIDDEETKHGIAQSMLGEFAKEITALKHLRLRGLMCIPRASTTTDARLASFAKMKTLQELLLKSGSNVDTLSMGMSHDYVDAIQSGANLIRLGTAIFGKRHQA